MVNTKTKFPREYTDQVISKREARTASRACTWSGPQATSYKLQAASHKLQAASFKQQASSTKLRQESITSFKPQAASIKLQAASFKLHDS